MTVVVFPFKEEDLGVIARNLAIAAGHERVSEVWAVAADEGATMGDVSRVAAEITGPIEVFPQERLGRYRSGKGDGMNTAIRLAAERGFERAHFYDADITNFDETWIDGAEAAADRGYGVVRHRFPRAATDAMITWMITRPGLAKLFPGSILPRLGQPLGGEILLGHDALKALASDRFVVDRSDWGIDTVITHATALLDAGIYEHNAPDGKRHALYGSLTDIREMVLECLDAVASLRQRSAPPRGVVFDADPPAEVPADLKDTVAYDLGSTRAAVAEQPDAAERAVLETLGMFPAREDRLDEERWGQVLDRALRDFDLTSEAWRSAMFRLWALRVIRYTVTMVPDGYDAAIGHLEETIRRYEDEAYQDEAR